MTSAIRHLPSASNLLVACSLELAAAWLRCASNRQHPIPILIIRKLYQECNNYLLTLSVTMADADGAEKTTFIFKKPFYVFSDKIFKIPASFAPSHTCSQTRPVQVTSRDSGTAPDASLFSQSQNTTSWMVPYCLPLNNHLVALLYTENPFLYLLYQLWNSTYE